MMALAVGKTRVRGAIQLENFPNDVYRKQVGQRCPKRRVAQAAIRLATAVITFRNKERNVRSPS